jgi:hypothetical protein
MEKRPLKRPESTRRKISSVEEFFFEDYVFAW